MATRTASSQPRVFLDRSIECVRNQLAGVALFPGKGTTMCRLDEFDLETERLIGELFGQASDLLHADEYAELGEAAGLANMPDEAPECPGMDGQRKSLLQRNRVLESGVLKLEARRLAAPKTSRIGPTLIGPQIAEHKSAEFRMVFQDASLREAGRAMKDTATRHPAVTQDGQITGVFFVSNILRYYSGIV